MHPTWQEYLLQQTTNCRPGDASDNTIFKLDAEALLQIDGPDAQDFLQSQLSNDILQITADHGQLNCYCNPKGRLIALLHCIPDNSKTHLSEHAGIIDNQGNSFAGYFLLLPESLAAAFIQRLTLYRMRTKVNIQRTGQWVHFGASGEKVREQLQKLGLLPEASRYHCKAVQDCQAIYIDSNRYAIIASPEQAMRLWERLREFCNTADIRCWRYADIVTGRPNVYEQNHETFIPQMLNLDLLGAISFSKGCYPGQEIIARMRYLGRNRQRMLYCISEHQEGVELAAGMPVYGQDQTQKIGVIVDAVCDADGNWQLLATIKLDYARQPLHVISATGPKLHQQPLPYPIPELQP